MLNLIAVNNTACVLVPVLANYTSYLPRTTSPEHYHNVYHMVVVVKGQCMVEKGDGRRVMREGDIVLIDPGQKHVFHGGENALHNFAFNFYLLPWETVRSGRRALHDPAREQKYFDENALREPFGNLFHVRTRDTFAEYSRARWQEIVDLVREFRSEIAWYVEEMDEGNRAAGVVRHIGRCVRFLDDMVGKLMRTEGHSAAQSSHRSHDPLTSSVIKYLMDNLEVKLDLALLGKSMGYTVPYLCNHFKKATGTSIGVYAMQSKIRRACEFLRTTERSITDIALSLSFCSSQHFSRAFKQVKGVTPGQYRRNAETL